MTSILKAYKDKFEKDLYRTIKNDESMHSLIYESMDYSLRAGGKRIRPIIMMMSAELFAVSYNDIMPFACALEMIHTYSLIHDDLPCMDDDDLRRGKPTNHKVYGEAVATLAGDALLNMSMQIVSEAEFSVCDKNVLKAINELYTASGPDGMIGGQIIDIVNEGKKIGKDSLKKLHSMKTGALIRAAGRVAAVLGGADDEKLSAVTSYCENLGIAFQIVDDLLDVFGDSKELGKNTGSDEANDKTTYVTLFGEKEAQKMAIEYTNRAKESLALFGEDAKNLLFVADYLTNRKK